jgi:1-acyl-sn-glycerol-3-phosphate acyltransferase
MRRLRALLHALWLYGATVLLALLYTPLLLAPRSVLRGGVRLWARLMMAGLRVIGGVRIEVRGLEHLPAGSALVAAKHQSMFDIIPPYAVLPDALFVMKKELMRIPIFGALCRKNGMIVVDREAHAAALRRLVTDARERLAEPRQLFIFPEGTRTVPGAAPDYKPGIAALYRDLELPCVPMATNSGVHLDVNGVAKRPGVVVLQLLEPIPPGLKRADFMRILQERIETASNALLAEGL